MLIVKPGCLRSESLVPYLLAVISNNNNLIGPPTTAGVLVFPVWFMHVKYKTKKISGITQKNIVRSCFGCCSCT